MKNFVEDLVMNKKSEFSILVFCRFITKGKFGTWNFKKGKRKKENAKMWKQEKQINLLEK